MEWEPARYGESGSVALAPGLRLVVTRDIGSRGGPPPKWRTSVFEAKLKAEFDNAEDAKAAAVRAARKWIGQAVEKLS